MGATKVSDILNIQYPEPNGRNGYSILNKQSKRNRKNYSPSKAQQKAMYLADKFKNPGGVNFYLKCAWNLTDEYLDWLVEYSFTKDNATKYFIKVANLQMVDNA